MAEPRYTPTQLAELYCAFRRDPKLKERREAEDFNSWEQTEVVIRCLGYVRNQTSKKFPLVKHITHRKNIFHEPTDGTLFQEKP
jgi:hypothetical protein